jgi:hypothetical protein
MLPANLRGSRVGNTDVAVLGLRRQRRRIAAILLGLARADIFKFIEEMGPTRSVAAFGDFVVRDYHLTATPCMIARRQSLAAGAFLRRRKIRPMSATNAQTPSSRTNPQRWP